MFIHMSNVSGILMTPESRIQLLTAKPTYVPGEKIQIIGAFNPNDLIHIDLVNPFDGTKNSTLIQSDNTGHFRTNYVVPYNAVNGTWKILATSGVNHASLDIQVISSNYERKNENTTHVYGPLGPVTIIQIESPLQQFRHGTISKDVTCWERFQLILKAEDSSPACVKSDSVSKLVLISWAKNPLSELLLKYTNQTQANLVFYDVMNEPQVKSWSMTGWKYNSYVYGSVGDPQKFSATIHLYLSTNDKIHPECKNGSLAFVVMNLKPIEIEHNYTKVGCMPDYKDWNRLGSNLK